MTHSEKIKQSQVKEAYAKGVQAKRSGLPDVNQYSKADIMLYCAWSAGYFDTLRGMA